MNLENKKIVVVGLRRSGVAVARFAAARGAHVTVTDMADETSLGEFIQQIGDRISDGTVTLELKGHCRRTFETADLVVVSPGVPHTILPIRQAMAKGVPVMGEIELASRFIEQPIVAITGTNGKTTTTNLLGQMLDHSGIATFVGGNIGNPLIEYAHQETKASVVVAEVSSFQLDTILLFRPAVGILLNITDDHLDRYDGIIAYARSKARLFMNQQPEDVAILNGKDMTGYSFLKGIPGQKWIFNSEPGQDMDSLGEDVVCAAVLDDTRITLLFEGDHHVLDLSGCRLPGSHNRENMAAAALGALAMGASMEGIQKAADTFSGLDHRLAYVGKVNQVAYYNDSKATNVDAVKRAVETFSRPVVLIMGGRDKGGRFHLLAQIMKERVRAVVVMGESARTLGRMFNGTVPVSYADGMKDAVEKAAAHARPGDVVLLSPGCASFDMYDSYGHRGRDFETKVGQFAKTEK